MPIEDSFLKVYFLGTQQEIDHYLSQREDQLQSEFNAAFISTGVIGLFAIPYALPLLADAAARMAYTILERDVDILSKEGVRKIAQSPGLVGIIRGFVE